MLKNNIKEILSRIRPKDDMYFTLNMLSNLVRKCIHRFKEM